MSTKIEWTDEVWNPMTGCTKISSGCDHCYAHVVAERRTRDIYLRQLPVKDTPENRANPFAPRFWDGRLEIPMRWNEPRRIFVNSMSDVFHAHFSVEQIRMVFEVMNACPQHQFQLLTKRPERAVRLAAEFVWTENIWMSVISIEDTVAHRADALRKIPAATCGSFRQSRCSVLWTTSTSTAWTGSSGAARVVRATDRSTSNGLSGHDLCRRRDVSFFWKQVGRLHAEGGQAHT